MNECVCAGDLSGGEKARVALAAFALVPCNLLLLDEASNHLDAATINALTAALQVTHLPLSCFQHRPCHAYDIADNLVGTWQSDLKQPLPASFRVEGTSACVVSFAQADKIKSLAGLLCCIALEPICCRSPSSIICDMLSVYIYIYNVRSRVHLLLQAFDGAIVAITHNKAFADNLRATHVLRVQVCSHSNIDLEPDCCFVLHQVPAANVTPHICGALVAWCH